MDTLYDVITQFFPQFSLPAFAMMCFGAVLVYIIFYTTKDVFARSESFLFMFFALLLVTAIPLLGFALYILIRPSSRTLERKMYAKLQIIEEQLHSAERKHLPQAKHFIHKKISVQSKKVKKQQ